MRLSGAVCDAVQRSYGLVLVGLCVLGWLGFFSDPSLSDFQGLSLLLTCSVSRSCEESVAAIPGNTSASAEMMVLRGDGHFSFGRWAL